MTKEEVAKANRIINSIADINRESENVREWFTYFQLLTPETKDLIAKVIEEDYEMSKKRLEEELARL